MSTTPPLAGHLAVVTGAARGIGQEIAIHLASEGADIASLDLSDSAETVAAVEALGRRAISVQTDVALQASVDDAVTAVTEQLSEASIVVNNAGLHPH